MPKKSVAQKINSPNQFGFATDIVYWTETICNQEVNYIEFVLEIPYGRTCLKKLVYACGNLVGLYKENLKPKICVQLKGKHEVCKYKTKRPQYLTDLGIYKIKDLSIILKADGNPKFKWDFYKQRKQRYAPQKEKPEFMQKKPKSNKWELPSWIEIIPRKNSNKSDN